MDERLKKQLDFLLEIDKVKNIFRQTHLSGKGRNENDAEHSWHIAIMAYLLREYSNEEIDIAKVMFMCLIHDIVEIDAGDTYAYDSEALKTQKLRENTAKERPDASARSAQARQRLSPPPDNESMNAHLLRKGASPSWSPRPLWFQKRKRTADATSE